jgi:hypothetical protein
VPNLKWVGDLVIRLAYWRGYNHADGGLLRGNKMKRLIVAFSMLAALSITGNPVVVIYETEAACPMISESVNVSIEPEAAKVEGIFRYRKLPKAKAQHPLLEIWVPVLIESGSIDPQKTMDPKWFKTVNMKAHAGKEESMGEPVHPKNPKYLNHPAVSGQEGLDIL